MDINDKISIMNEAHKNYSKIFNSDYSKFFYLPEWQFLESTLFIKEIDMAKNNTKKIYKQYKRGTIVRVNFGVNVGSELCGPHFAIVLNKNDSKNNKNLQVVPLSSKKNRHRIAIDKEIFEKITENLISKTKEILEIDNEMQLSVLESLDLEKLTSLIIEMLETNNIDNTPESAYMFIKLIRIMRDDSIPTLQESFERTIELIKSILNDPSKIYYKNEKELLTVILDNFEDVLPKITENQRRLSDLTKVLEEYQKYSKNSYVCISDIYTISKERIIEMNQYDPSGNIFCSDNTLNIINEGLKKQLII